MLVLSRHRDESIVIAPGTPEEIVITVVDIRHDKTRLGITAPAHITVHRSEVQAAIEAENRQREGGGR